LADALDRVGLAATVKEWQVRGLDAEEIAVALRRVESLDVRERDGLRALLLRSLEERDAREAFRRAHADRGPPRPSIIAALLARDPARAERSEP
jgi:hypothetical protein